MIRSPFDPRFEDLPDVLPIFPLPGVLLLPGGKLPLNVFEPRYLAMTRDALAGPRLIGMVQPQPRESEPAAAGEGEEEGGDLGAWPVFHTGCAGRITAFGETDDGRYLITLTGLLRFDIAEELPARSGYRCVRPDWSSYRGDLGNEVAAEGGALDRARLLQALRGYFEAAGLQGDWEAIRSAPDTELVTSLAMLCPFDTREKQALLEAPTLGQRAETMIAILEMASLDQGDGQPARH